MILSQYVLHSLVGNCLLALNIWLISSSKAFLQLRDVTLKTLLYKSETIFNLVKTTVRPISRELSSDSTLTPWPAHHPGSAALDSCKCNKRICQEQCCFINLICKCMPNNYSYCENPKSQFFCFILILLDDLHCTHFQGAAQRLGISCSSTFLFAPLSLIFLTIESQPNLSFAEEKQKPREGEGSGPSWQH